MPSRVESFNLEVVKKNPVELLHRELLKMTGPALIVVMFVASCGALNGSKEGPVSSGERVTVGEPRRSSGEKKEIGVPCCRIERPTRRPAGSPKAKR